MNIVTQLILAAAVMGASSNAMAKQFILNNTSSNHKPITVELQIVRQNVGKPAVAGETRTLQLIDSKPLTINEEGFERVGITLLSVNGHRIPGDSSQFSHVMESALNNPGPVTMDFALEETPGGHGKISVAVH